MPLFQLFQPSQYFLLMSFIEQQLMISQSAISENRQYDIILIGNLASILGAAIITKTKYYTIAALHIQNKIEEHSLSPLHQTQINIHKKPKDIEIIRERVVKIQAKENYLVLEGGRRVGYKLLVYGEQAKKWTQIQNQNAFLLALKCPFSLVYSDYHMFFQKALNCVSGNLVFYIGQNCNFLQQNYPFLYFYDKLTAKQRGKLSFTILLENNRLYPHCPLAHRILQEELINNKFKIVYDVQIATVDYIRRVLHIKVKQKQQSISYACLYYFLPESPPKLLQKSSISPSQIHPKLLHNLQHDNIYIIGGSTLPTTHSFTAINKQIQIIIKNIRLRLDHLLFNKQMMEFSVYNGETSIRIFISDVQFLQISHGYKDSQHTIQKHLCSKVNFFVSETFQRFLVEKYYNYNSFGLLYYFWNACENMGSKKNRLQQSNHNLIYSKSEPQKSIS